MRTKLITAKSLSPMPKQNNASFQTMVHISLIPIKEK